MEKVNTPNKIKPKESVSKAKYDADTGNVPESLQPLLWSRNVKNLDFKKDKIYIIHQVLAYGSIEDIKYIINIYSKDEVINVFINNPLKVYTRPVFLFIKNYMFKIKTELKESNYVRSFY
jgi:hypothetical protein